MSRKLRVLHLTHPHLLPPDSLEGFSDQQVHVFKTDYDVVVTLKQLGHEVQSLGIEDELRPIRSMVRSFKPQIVFNLVESFAGLGELDQHVVSYLELLRQPYTGCNPRGLVLARGKALSKKLLAYHRIHSPAFAVFPMGRRVRRPRQLALPVIVKSLIEEASAGIAQASIVDTDEKLAERVAFIHENVGTDAIAEQYIEGRELYVSVLGNQRLTVLPTWELRFESMPAGAAAIATERAKKDVATQERWGMQAGLATDLPPDVERRIGKLTKRIYRILGLDGYARVDYRLSADGQLYFLEANPNCEIAEHEEFAEAAKHAGIAYPQLIQRLVNLGLRRAGPVASAGDA
ncbi:MAG: D-alanine--D-alanine ligase [Planctomycetota bacterium]|nr:MAG: D-alanine--D-alanine ligase [Planctomycetota bacterium]